MWPFVCQQLCPGYPAAPCTSGGDSTGNQSPHWCQISPLTSLKGRGDVLICAHVYLLLLTILKHNNNRKTAKQLDQNMALCSQKSVHPCASAMDAMKENGRIRSTAIVRIMKRGFLNQVWKHTGKNPSIYLYRYL